MKINLQYEITIEIVEGSKEKESLKVIYTQGTKAQKAQQKEGLREYQALHRNIRKISSKYALFSKKLTLLETLKETKQSLQVVEDLEVLSQKIQKNEDKLEKLIGNDEEAFFESLAKIKFEHLVSGADKGKLAKYAEQKGYINILASLESAKAELEKKPSGK